MIYEDFQKSEAQHPGSIFGLALSEDDKIEFFSHRPYDRYSNITHEDLSPMCYRATVRGRLEKDDQGRPVLTLKDPQSVREYFEFKNVPAVRLGAKGAGWSITQEPQHLSRLANWSVGSKARQLRNWRHHLEHRNAIAKVVGSLTGRLDRHGSDDMTVAFDEKHVVLAP